MYKVIFHGVRGSYPVPGKDTLKYGGNTPCIQLLINDKNIVLDAGTGISKLGQELQGRQEKVQIQLFLSHTHWDHIQGFPFFQPAYQKNNWINIYGLQGIKETIEGQMKYPYFPIDFNELKSCISFTEIEPREQLEIDDIIIKTINGQHDGDSLLYRIEANAKSCSYIVDYEHLPELDERVTNFVQDTDLLIYDSLFTEEEYQGLNGTEAKKGWGHSYWQQGVKLANRANVKKLILFHHAPTRTDKELIRIEGKAREIFPVCSAAREGMIIKL